MKKLLAIAVSAAFAVSSFGALAQDKKQEVKSKQGGEVKSAGKDAVTTATDKPKKEAGKGPEPKNIGKRKDEKERMDKK